MRVWQKALMFFRGADQGPGGTFPGATFPGTTLFGTAFSGATAVRANPCGRPRRRSPQRHSVTARHLLTVERLENRILLTFDPTGLEQEMLEHLSSKDLIL